MIYLASPYSSGYQTRIKRFNEACRYVADQTNKGEVIFSPIVHSHPLVKYNVGSTWEYWEKIDKAFIDKCDKVRVLKLPGWKKSIGVTAEIEYAKSKGIEIEYVDPAKD